jgi:hypothetical protein
MKNAEDEIIHKLSVWKESFEKDEINRMKMRLLIQQYNRCAEDWRYYDKLLWEIPFTTATVLGAILAIIYGKGVIGGGIPAEVKIPILGCLLIFLFTMLFLARKVRFLQESRTRFAECIEKQIARIEIPMSTDRSIRFFRALGNSEANKRFIKYRAVHFQNLLFLSLASAIIFLLYCEGLLGIICLLLVAIGLCIAYFYDSVSKHFKRLIN